MLGESYLFLGWAPIGNQKRIHELHGCVMRYRDLSGLGGMDSAHRSSGAAGKAAAALLISPLEENAQCKSGQAHGQQGGTQNTGGMYIEHDHGEVKTDDTGGVEDHVQILHSVGPSWFSKLSAPKP